MSTDTEIPSPAPAADVPRLAEHLFRHEGGKLVSALTGIFGIERLTLAEDVVQEAMLRALKTWPYYGIPKNPAAWLTQTAKNLALDVIRRETRFREKQPEITATVESAAVPQPSGESTDAPNEIQDETLRLMFTCFHPLIPPEAQIALALKTLCGFSPAEIANAFLTSEAAIAKRLVRARQKIREAQIPFEIPVGEELSARLDGVLQTLYLLFNEGYKASSGENLVREELCFEAIRLACLLAAHPIGDLPRTHALAALMLLNGARLPARVDLDGNILLLKDQDRSRWSRPMINRGFFHLARSATGGEVSEYHFQAGIAACHCAAPDYSSTDWPRILGLYDSWFRVNRSPVVALNRAVALAQVRGASAGMKAVETVLEQESLQSYHLLYAVMADLETQLNNFPAAATHLRKALQLTETEAEKSFLSKRLRECEGQTGELT